MKWTLLLLSLVLGTAGATKETIFRSPTGEFQFSYPNSCELVNKPFPQTTYLPICDKTALACVKYRSGGYLGTNFEGAAFEVTTVPDANTAHKCMASPSLQTVPAQSGAPLPTKPDQEEINGVLFRKGVDSSVGLGHQVTTHAFRTFRNGMCYELRMNVAQSSFENFPAGTVREFTRADEDHVVSDLKQILHSFTFLK